MPRPLLTEQWHTHRARKIERVGVLAMLLDADRIIVRTPDKSGFHFVRGSGLFGIDVTVSDRGSCEMDRSKANSATQVSLEVARWPRPDPQHPVAD